MDPHRKIEEVKSGKEGRIVYTANWTDQQNNILLKEKPLIHFISLTIKRISKESSNAKPS